MRPLDPARGETDQGWGRWIWGQGSQIRHLYVGCGRRHCSCHRPLGDRRRYCSGCPLCLLTSLENVHRPVCLRQPCRHLLRRRPSCARHNLCPNQVGKRERERVVGKREEIICAWACSQYKHTFVHQFGNTNLEANPTIYNVHVGKPLSKFCHQTCFYIILSYY